MRRSGNIVVAAMGVVCAMAAIAFGQDTATTEVVKVASLFGSYMPEPSTYGLLAGASVMIGLVASRRRDA